MTRDAVMAIQAPVLLVVLVLVVGALSKELNRTWRWW